MGATRNIALSEQNIRGISVNPVGGSSTINVVPSDSGVMFINKSTGTNTNYVLPTTIADGAGKMWWFLNAVAGAGFRVTAPTNTLVANNTLIKNYATTTANNVGFGCIVVGDGSKYYLFELGSQAFTSA